MFPRLAAGGHLPAGADAPLSWLLPFVRVSRRRQRRIDCVRALRDGTGRAPLSLRDRSRWWSFFVAKSVLLLIGPVCWHGARSLALPSTWLVRCIPWRTGLRCGSSSSFPRDRSPGPSTINRSAGRICLRRLGTPIQIGAPGYVLLNWSGTEMVCSEGHGGFVPSRLPGQLAGTGSLGQSRRFVAGLFREE